MSRSFDGERLAELSGVSKRYGNTVALDRLDLHVLAGELLAVLGPNGAGKTTAISLLLGLEQPDCGSVRLLGQSPLQLESRQQVGVMMQEVQLAPELRVCEHLDLVASYYPAPLSPEAAMQMTHTTSLGSRRYGDLSSGQKRQAQFAIAVCGRPRLLFLDEPTVGLDVQARELMWTTLRRLVADGSSIVLTTHYIEEAEALADRVTVLTRGRLIASGSVPEVRGLVVRKEVSCSTTLPVDELRTWSGVESVRWENERVHIATSSAEDVIRRLLAADQGLSELEVRRAGLAEAFAELTREAS
jgi:ABC-2 type transport system ATP-binding protein